MNCCLDFIHIILLTKLRIRYNRVANMQTENMQHFPKKNQGDFLNVI
jgi:hypothetical protein